MSNSFQARIGRGPCLLLSTCAYAVVAFALVGGSFAATLAVLPEQNETKAATLAVLPEQNETKIGTQVAAKIGPGYGRMRAIDFGRPEKPLYTAHATGAHSSPKVTAATRATLPVLSIIASAESSSPLMVAVAQPPYSAPDIHRVY